MDLFLQRNTQRRRPSPNPRTATPPRTSRNDTPQAKRPRIGQKEPIEQSPAQQVSNDDADTAGSELDESQPLDIDIQGGHREAVIEDALPLIKTDREAIEEYETMRASQASEPEDATSRFDSRRWVRGKSSIYVDAFNLALDTVLEDESHLFDEKELAIFSQWRELDYEAQFL